MQESNAGIKGKKRNDSRRENKTRKFQKAIAIRGINNPLDK
jgi:hypothetical protein